MTFDAELRDLAGLAAQAHVRSDGFASATVKSRVRHARRVYRTAVAAGSVAVVGLVGALSTIVVQGWPEPAPPAETVAPSPDGTAEPSPTPSRTAEPLQLTVDGVLSGWGALDVDPAMFEDVGISDSVTVDGRATAVGCQWDNAGLSGFPAWYADDAATWVQASGPTSNHEGQLNTCLTQVVATPHGLYAVGLAGLFHSDDGSTWDEVTLPLEYGSGTFPAVFAVGDRVTVLFSVSHVEESVAELYTTDDGSEWTQVTDGSATVFDNATVAGVIGTADGLLAVGASPGGSFVPTAAAWVSSDGLTWELVTPAGEGFEGAFMTAVTSRGNGYAAVGRYSFGTGLMCAWSSPDGRTWTPEAPADPVDSGVYLAPMVVAFVGDDLYAAGQDVDMSRAEGEQVVSALWRRVAGGPWERLDAEAVGAVPFAQTEVGGVVVGFWPGYGWPAQVPVQVLTPAV
jgi:hypothetical protein